MYKDTALYKKLMSNENIYHAIYSVESYIENKELLNEEETAILHKLRDKFNEELILDYIKKVKAKIDNLVNNEDEYIIAKVYFKPKKLENLDEIEFRPLHITSIVNYITITAMIQVLVYESANVCKDCNMMETCNKKINVQNEYSNNNCNKLILSSLSRLMPSNFYGNRISTRPDSLIIPWKDQYKEYTTKAIEYFKKYHESEEYRYEIDLDLKKFFPSINPTIVYNYIISKLPVTYDKLEIDLIKNILIKLLFIKIDINIDNIEMKKLYYTSVQDINKVRLFVLGLPQGLPQAYFFANLCMIEISKIYDGIFKGKSLYYVDDSVIFTNELKCEGVARDEEFTNKIDIINKKIKKFETKYSKVNKSDKNEKLLKATISMGYGIEVHDINGKSSYSDIRRAKPGEIYLNGISREISKTSFDLNTSLDDNEDITLKNRLNVLINSINKEIDIINKPEDENSDIDNFIQKFVNEMQNTTYKTKDNQWEIYTKKLIRYKKYFKYRHMMLEYREQNNYDILCNNILGLFKKIQGENGLQEFIDIYKNDIFSSIISFIAKHEENYIDKEKVSSNHNKIVEELIRVNNLLFDKYSISLPNNKLTYSYFYKSFQKYIERGDYQLKLDDNIRYATLKEKVEYILPDYRIWHEKEKEKAIKEIVMNMHINNFEFLFVYKLKFFNKFFDTKFSRFVFSIIDDNTDEINRMLLNTIFSHIFCIEINDACNFVKKENRMITYRELRTLLYLRNSNFVYSDFLAKISDLQTPDNLVKIDYSILEVTKQFRTFVRNPNQIDDLILVHRYTYEVWKNGSKYLYFYTLHNQEHAIDLIKNSIKIVKSISFIQLSKFDYYILFIACYLHDISMVTIPSMDRFLKDNSVTNSIYVDFIGSIKARNSSNGEVKNNDLLNILNDSRYIKKLLNDYYHKLDAFYENEVRSNHQKDSGNEIRNRRDLYFLDDLLRDVIAEVAEAHGYDSAEVYKVKSVAQDRMISKKFMQIVLRLADLFDMSSYRVSQPILNNNLSNMSQTSAFHWLSHIMTEDYELEVKYENELIESERVIKKNRKNIDTSSDGIGVESYLDRKKIIEIITIKIKVKISQMNKEETISCKDMALVDTDIKQCSLKYEIGKVCISNKCNFLCKWMVCKNEYLFSELNALQKYLNDNEDNYYKSKFIVQVDIDEKTSLSTEQFEIINNHIQESFKNRI